MKTANLENHFNAIKSIVEPYHGRRIVDALPSALYFVIQFWEVVEKSNSPHKDKLLRQLDSVTDMIGKLGDIVTSEEFEQIKEHYSAIQLTISAKNSEEHEDKI